MQLQHGILIRLRTATDFRASRDRQHVLSTETTREQPVWQKWSNISTVCSPWRWDASWVNCQCSTRSTTDLSLFHSHQRYKSQPVCQPDIDTISSTQVQVYQYSYPRVIPLWNRLPGKVSLPTTRAFQVEVLPVILWLNFGYAQPRPKNHRPYLWNHPYYANTVSEIYTVHSVYWWIFR